MFDIVRDDRVFGERVSHQRHLGDVGVACVGLAFAEASRDVVDDCGRNATLLQRIGQAVAQGMQGSLPQFIPEGRLHEGHERVVEAVAGIVPGQVREQIREQGLIAQFGNMLPILHKMLLAA